MDVNRTIEIEDSWKQHLREEFQADYMRDLSAFLRAQKREGKEIYPKGPDIFAAFELTPFDAVKVVILGQDPYHGPGQAHGLSFSVQPGVKPPPSLVNIYRELESDLGIPPPSHGCLKSWSEQGVLLLNAILTVERGRAGSHHGRGWERFTDQVMLHLNKECDGLVFILWGKYAQQKAAFIDESKHCVIRSAHPSPFSARNGFFGSRPFSRANAYLVEHGKTPINWGAIQH